MCWLLRILVRGFYGRLRPVLSELFLAVGVVFIYNIVLHVQYVHAAEQIGPLTEKETLGAIFMTHHGPNRKALRAGSPNAKAIIYEILGSGAVARYHENSFIVLGYIGDGSDVVKMSGILDSLYRGTLTSAEQHAIHGLFVGLGILSRRGVPEATELLDKMSDLRYWRKLRFRWRKERSVSMTDVLACIMLAVEAQAISRRADVEMLLRRIANDFDDERLRTEFLMRAQVKGLSSLIEKMESEESRALTDQERKSLKELGGLFELRIAAAKVANFIPLSEAEIEEYLWEGRAERLIANGDASVVPVLRAWIAEAARRCMSGRKHGMAEAVSVAIYGLSLFHDNDKKVLDDLKLLYQFDSRARSTYGRAIAYLGSEREADLLFKIMNSADMSLSARAESAASLIRLDRGLGRQFLLDRLDQDCSTPGSQPSSENQPIHEAMRRLKDEVLLNQVRDRLAKRKYSDACAAVVSGIADQVAMNRTELKTLEQIAVENRWPDCARTRYMAIEALGRNGGHDVAPFLEDLPRWIGDDVPIEASLSLTQAIQDAIAEVRRRHWAQ